MTGTSKGFTAAPCVGVALVVLCALFSVAAAQSCVQSPAGIVSCWPGEGIRMLFRVAITAR